MCHVQDESHQETEQENDEHTNTLIGVPDTYQDGEFYQALLSEFLEGSTHLLTKNLHKVCDDTTTCTRLTFEKKISYYDETLYRNQSSAKS